MTDDERTAAEMRSIMRFALGLGLTRQTVMSIYETVGQEAAAAGASDDDRMAEARTRMLAAAETKKPAAAELGGAASRRGVARS